MGAKERIADDKLVLDGAMGTMLNNHGMEAGSCPEKWGLDHPEVLKNIHAAYLDAGSSALTTNTFGGTRYYLQHIGLADQVTDINRRLAEITAEVATGSECIVFGGVGPTGQFLEPMGDVAEEEMRNAFADQIEGLLQGGAQAILIETMTDLAEAVVAVEAAHETAPDLPVLATMAFNKDANGFRTMMGVSPEKAAAALEKAGVDAVGANCGEVDVGDVTTLVGEFRHSCGLPIMIQPNAGLPELIDGEAVFGRTGAEMAAAVPSFMDAGATIIGGCCGNTPAHIQMVAQAVTGG